MGGYHLSFQLFFLVILLSNALSMSHLFVYIMDYIFVQHFLCDVALPTTVA